MKRDTIFYQLFRQSPSLLFELIPNPPENAQDYRFDSVAVKEPKFEIDGVFLPPTGDVGTIFICEVQFQKDELLYERIYAETFPYFYQNRSQFSDWQIVVIYPSRKIEQKDTYPFRSSIASGQLHRVYLDELGSVRQLPLWVALMVLTVTSQTKAPSEARYLLSRAKAEVSTAESRAIMEMVATIISYKFEHISRGDVEKMLGITFEETRVYQEIRQEALEEGREKGREEAREEGRQVAINSAVRLLSKKLGSVDEGMKNSIEGLSSEALEALPEASLDFSSQDDLQRWLDSHKPKA